MVVTATATRRGSAASESTGASHIYVLQLSLRPIGVCMLYTSTDYT